MVSLELGGLRRQVQALRRCTGSGRRGRAHQFVVDPAESHLPPTLVLRYQGGPHIVFRSASAPRPLV